MLDRLHPADLRAIVVSILTGSFRSQGCTWAWAINCGEDLLAKLEATAKPKPEPIADPREDSINYWKKRAEKSEAERQSLLQNQENIYRELNAAQARVRELGQEVANLTYSNNAHREMAESWRGRAIVADQLEKRLAAIEKELGL